MSKRIIRELMIGDNLQIIKNFKFIETKDIKAVQLNPEEVSKYRNAGGWVNHTGVEFVVFPDGLRGIRYKFEDGTEKYLKFDANVDKVVEVYPYKDTFMENSFKRNLDKFFGVSDEMVYNSDRRIDYIHMAMFLFFFLIATGIFGTIAWFVKDLL